MKIEINCTIIIQMINFIIAYCIIRWAFKPLSRVIKSRRDEHDYLQRGIIGLKHDLMHAAEVHQAKWQAFSTSMSDQIARIYTLKPKPLSVVPPWSALLAQPVDEKLINDIVHTVTKTLEEDLHG